MPGLDRSVQNSTEGEERTPTVALSRYDRSSYELVEIYPVENKTAMETANVAELNWFIVQPILL